MPRYKEFPNLWKLLIGDTVHLTRGQASVLIEKPELTSVCGQKSGIDWKFTKNKTSCESCTEIYSKSEA